MNILFTGEVLEWLFLDSTSDDIPPDARVVAHNSTATSSDLPLDAAFLSTATSVPYIESASIPRFRASASTSTSTSTTADVAPDGIAEFLQLASVDPPDTSKDSNESTTNPAPQTGKFVLKNAYMPKSSFKFI